MFQARRFRRDFLTLRVDLVRRCNDCDSFAIVDDERPLFFELRFVHRNERCTEPVTGIRSDGPLNAVVRDDRDVVAAFDAQRRQTSSEIVDEFSDFAVLRPIPRPVRLYAEQIVVRIALHGTFEHIHECFEIARHVFSLVEHLGLRIAFGVLRPKPPRGFSQRFPKTNPRKTLLVAAGS